jgi:hypothetical protein
LLTKPKVEWNYFTLIITNMLIKYVECDYHLMKRNLSIT